MKKIIIAVACLLFAAGATAGDELVRCFSAGKINLKFGLVRLEGIDFAYVKYQHSKQAIPLLLVSTEVVAMADDTYPPMYFSKWAEMVNQQVHGYYEIGEQKGKYYTFNYISRQNKITQFEENWNAYDEQTNDCQW